MAKLHIEIIQMTECKNNNLIKVKTKLAYPGYHVKELTFPFIIHILSQVYNPQIRANSQVLRTISKHQADMRAQRVNSHLPGMSKVMAAVTSWLPAEPIPDSNSDIS